LWAASTGGTRGLKLREQKLGVVLKAA
jgi:hypothetical protein